MRLYLKVSFQEKIPQWLFHHEWSNSSGGDTHRAQVRNADGALGNRAPSSPADPPWNAGKAGAWGLQPPVPVCKEAVWQQCSHTTLRLLSNTRKDDFSLPQDEPWHRRCCSRKDKENWVWTDRDVFAPHASALPSAAVGSPHLSHKWQSKNCFVATGSP